MKKWAIYEEAAKRVVADLRALLGVEAVGAKQKIPGLDGAIYELDAVAWTDAVGNFLLVEAKRHKRGLSQDTVNAVAYKLMKVGASGAIIVNPVPLQRGAKNAADFDSIIHITLSADSTAQDYLAEYSGNASLVRRFPRTLSLQMNAMPWW